MKSFLIFALLFLFLNSSAIAQEITVFPGFWGQTYYQNSNRISVSEVKHLMKEIPYANDEWKKSQAQITGAWIAVGAQFGFLFWQLNKVKNGESGTPQLIGNLACGAVGIGLALASNNSRKRAILAYNKGIKEKSMGTYYFTPSSSGLGIAMQF